MEKLYNITLDGKLDEAAWESAKEFTGFRKMVSQGGEVLEVQTFFKVLQDRDCVYFGFKCMEPDIPHVIEDHPNRDIWGTDRVELFVSPSGGTYDFYQFAVTFGGKMKSFYYAEGGQIQLDPYGPDWEAKVHVDEVFWSVEIKIPLTAFYMNDNASMSDKWLLNPIRGRTKRNVPMCDDSSACALESKFMDFDRWLVVDGFHKRPAENDLRIVSALVDINDKNEKGYCGAMEVKTVNAVAETLIFSSNYGETTQVSLQAGVNVFTVPCCFQKLGRDRLSLELTRESDGTVFKRYYPVRVAYEPIKLRFSLPEYRCNFYPGQDYSKIVGTAVSSKPVTLKLEGPGIETVEIQPNADGSFCFETPGFEEGEAWLTATAGDEVKKQKIRRLAPTGRMMTWISGGNLIVNGKPVLSRTAFSPGYRCGKVFHEKYLADNYHETREITNHRGFIAPRPVLTRNLKMPKAEVFEDRMPSEELLRYYDQAIEAAKEYDFAYYYISDEPECAGVSPIYLRHIYEYLADRDPYHVINMASRSAKSYVECADWFETHPYIGPEDLPDGRRIYNRPMKTLGNFVDDIALLNRPDKCVGLIPQLYGYESKSIYADYPTFEEILCSSWAGMIHGGKTITPYACGDMRDRPCLEEGMRYLFSSFEALDKLVLFGKREQLLRTENAECVQYDNGDEKMFVLVNFNQEEQTVTVDGLNGQWHNFRHGGMLTGNTFILKPLEVLIGTNTVKDAGLPGYGETVALIDKLEAERKAGCSKLVAIRHSITLSGSVGATRHRLLDGVRDNLAAIVGKTGDRHLVADLSKVEVSCDRIVVSGWNLQGNISVRVKLGDAFVIPEGTEVKEDEMSTTYIFKGTVCPEAIRVDFFGTETMELYELEAF